VPAPHASHALDPFRAVKLPGPHASHAVAPVPAMNKPTPHAAHPSCWLPARSFTPYVPAGHATHRLSLTLTVRENVPSRQAWHAKGEPALLFRTYPLRHTHWSTDAPTGESEKAGHPWHVAAWYELYASSGQSSHVVAPSCAKVPAAHHAHWSCEDAPSLALYVPFGQESHVLLSLASTVSLYVPALQFVHVVATAGLKVPAAHALHDDESATEKVPAVQLEHTLAFSFE